MSQQGKSFKQRYYRNINILIVCRSLLISGNVQSENVAAVERNQKRYYWNFNIFSLCRPVLLTGNAQCEQIAAVEIFPTMILSER